MIEECRSQASQPARWAFLLLVAVAVGCGGGGGKDNENDGGSDGDVQCIPGEFLGCDGNDAILCETDGSSTVRNECGSAGCNQEAGQCNQCDPTTPASCQDYRIVTCDESGYIVESEYCTWGCSEVGGTPTCSECLVGEIACQDDSVETCGSGGTIADTQLCEHGCDTERAECNECEPLMIECLEDALVACDVDGTIEEREPCAHGCSDEHLLCLCEAGRSECDADTGILQHCDATGLPEGVELCALGCSTDGTDAWCNECEPDTTLCAGNDLQPCGSNGLLQPTIECPLGCNVSTVDATTHRCYSFTPTQLDESDLHLGTIDLDVTNTTVVIDTDNLTVNGVTPPPEVAATIVVQQHPDPLRTASDAPEIWVLHYRDVKVVAGTIEVVGTRALALVASDSITVAWGILDAGGHGTDPGPGGRERASTAWSGGTDPDGTQATSYTGCSEHVGAGGGGHAATGGTGGFYYIAGIPYSGEPGGGTISDETMEVLHGGGHGGGTGSTGFYAGAGGGALMLVAWRAVNVGGWARVDISGGGGFAWGAGGGAGGSLLIEAPSVHVAGMISAVGGGGACGAWWNLVSGEDGLDGGDGGHCTTTTSDGGDGGYSDSHPDTPGGSAGIHGHCGAPFPDDLSGGGGGGAIGRWRIRTGLWMDSLNITGSATLKVAPCGASPEYCADYLGVQ
jgi:hypothetical protein